MAQAHVFIVNPKSKIVLSQGDITRFEGDAIVNAGQNSPASSTCMQPHSCFDPSPSLLMYAQPMSACWVVEAWMVVRMTCCHGQHTHKPDAT